jgi:hypothetical protein
MSKDFLNPDSKRRIDIHTHVKENPEQKLWEPFHSITDDEQWLIAAYCQPLIKDGQASVWILYKDPSLLPELPNHPCMDLFNASEARTAKFGLPSDAHNELKHSTLKIDYWKHVGYFQKLKDLLIIESALLHLKSTCKEHECSACSFISKLDALALRDEVIIFCSEVEVAKDIKNVLNMLEQVLDSEKEDENSPGTNLEVYCKLNVAFHPAQRFDSLFFEPFLALPDHLQSTARELFMRKYLGSKASLLPLISEA